jgi:hypothetical protein
MAVVALNSFRILDLSEWRLVWCGFFVGSGTDIYHLRFADDTLLFCGTGPNHLCNLRSLFLCFEVVLGLKANLVKLELVPMGNVDNVAGILGCGVASHP